MMRMGRAAAVWPALFVIGWAVVIAGCAPSTAAQPAKSPTDPGQVSSDPVPVDPHAAPPTEKSSSGPYGIDDWWPNRLDLRVLKEDSPKGDPMDPTFDYAKEFSKLDLAAVKKDIEKTLTTSQDWWPADYGHYGGLMIRLAWHSAGTYRVTDGRGGAGSGVIRFAPLNSWPDNASLDKARRLLWPLKKKYGRALSWADLMILTGNVALESMGFKTLGFGGGREDVYEPLDINWGPETKWLADERFSADGKELSRPLGATQMGLIYVNPEGPGGNPDPQAAARHIRIAFGRMAMNDEETVALIAGGHTLGKMHGAAKASECVGPEPEAAPVEQQGLGWKNKCGTGKGADTITSGLEGAWTMTPAKWSHDYFSNMWTYEWELTKSPGGAQQWTPKGNIPASVPDAHVPGKFHKPVMLTTDLALKEDPQYRVISKRFYEHPEEFEAAFAKAWFKLTHRDMGPRVRLLGKEVPEPQLWQDPVPDAPQVLINAADISKLKKELLASPLTPQRLIETAWVAAASYRGTDMRGGANGARLRLAPQKDWAVNEPAQLTQVLPIYEEIQRKFNASARKVSLADLIVLGGCAAIEDAAKKGGFNITVPFAPGRTDATQDMTEVASFALLEPKSDGFRNYAGTTSDLNGAEQLVEKADMLNLTAPEMTVLVAGLRVLDANYGTSKHGVLTSAPGTLTNDFFVNLLDMSVEWKKSTSQAGVYEALDRKSGQVKWTGTDVDLVFGANSQLRALVEVYAADDAKRKFVDDFVAAWTKVMNAGRFDLKEAKKL